MRVFEQRAHINFVDKNDVFVGFDMTQDCCEEADWFFADQVPEPDDIRDRDDRHSDFDRNDWYFDPTYFVELKGGHLDEGGAAVFRLTDGNAAKFLVIYNAHNGYYAHGFEVKHGGVVVRSDVL